MKNDITMIGHISRDVMIYQGEELRLTGGPVIYCSAASARAGKKVQVITRASADAEKELDGMRADGVQVLRLDSEETTSIENIYFTPEKEKRKVTLLIQSGLLKPRARSTTSQVFSGGRSPTTSSPAWRKKGRWESTPRGPSAVARKENSSSGTGRPKRSSCPGSPFSRPMPPKRRS